MISPDEALRKILASVRPRASRTVALTKPVGCFAARDLVAEFSLPHFDNSSMDGYAVVAGSCALQGRLKVVGEQPAGIDRHLAIGPGEALRILTGAPIPAGADAVIMQEDVTLSGEEIILQDAVAPGENIRRRGGDIAAGQKILTAGDRIRPQMVALLAAQGLATLEVGGEVRAAIISTGDELAEPGAPLQPGQIYDSNSVLLQALLQELGVQVTLVKRCGDRAEEIEAALRAGAACDVMIISGGVSVGARDLVKPALSAIGATLDLWRVAVKPGKPFLFGQADRCAIFGLPGNPVSAFVTFLLFVRPAILRMMGAGEGELGLAKVEARLAQEVQNESDRPHYLRGQLRAGIFSPVGRQESHALFGLSRSNALLLVPAGGRFAAGAPVHALTWE